MDKKLRILDKLLYNMLGYNPDKFGLVLDDGGWTKLKSLHHAILHEPNFSWITPGLLKQFFAILGTGKYELNEKAVRLKPEFQSSKMPQLKMEMPPHVLYTSIKPRAYHAVSAKGLLAPNDQWLLLSMDLEEAKRIGAKKDSEPIIVEVKASKAEQTGCAFFKYGSIYLSKKVASQWLILPPPNRKIKEMEKIRTEKIANKKEKAPPPEHTPTGSFFLDLPTSVPVKKEKRKREPHWKEARRRSRRR